MVKVISALVVFVSLASGCGTNHGPTPVGFEVLECQVVRGETGLRRHVSIEVKNKTDRSVWASAWATFETGSVSESEDNVEVEPGDGSLWTLIGAKQAPRGQRQHGLDCMPMVETVSVGTEFHQVTVRINEFDR